jgi:hypothetical protein
MASSTVSSPRSDMGVALPPSQRSALRNLSCALLRVGEEIALHAKV